MKKSFIAHCATAMIGVFAPTVYAEGWTLATGVDMSKGKYGLAQDTQIRAEYLQVRYDASDWLLKLTFPYLHIQGLSNAKLLSDAFVLVDTGVNRQRSVEGFGDVMVSGSKAIASDKQGLWGIELTAKVKLPTANHQVGLGTGSADYTLQLETYATTNSLTYFTSLGYKWMGQVSEIDYHNILLASAGVAYQFSNQVTLGSVLEYRQSPLSYLLDQTEGMLFVSKRLDAFWQIQAYSYRGFNEASPDLGGGILVSRKW